jgi:hypothetical protein
MTQGLWLRQIGGGASVIEELLHRIRFLRSFGRPVLRSWFNPRRSCSVVTLHPSCNRLLFVDATAGDDSHVAGAMRFGTLAMCAPNLVALLQAATSPAFWGRLFTLLTRHRRVFTADPVRAYAPNWIDLLVAALCLHTASNVLDKASRRFLYITREKGMFSLAAIAHVHSMPPARQPRLLCLQHGTLFEDHMPARCEAYGCFTDDYRDFVRRLGLRTFHFSYWSVPQIAFDTAAKGVYLAINSSYLCDTTAYASAVCAACIEYDLMLACHPADRVLPSIAKEKGIPTVSGMRGITAALGVWFDQSTAGYTIRFDGPVVQLPLAEKSVLQRDAIYEETCRIRGH